MWENKVQRVPKNIIEKSVKLHFFGLKLLYDLPQYHNL